MCLVKCIHPGETSYQFNFTIYICLCVCLCACTHFLLLFCIDVVIYCSKLNCVHFAVSEFVCVKVFDIVSFSDIASTW